MVQVLTAETARLWRAFRRAIHCPLRASPRSSATVRTSPEQGIFATVGGAWDRRVRHGTQRWGRSAAERRACVVKGRLARAARRTRRGRQLRQTGTRSQSDSHWLARWGALGFRFLGFTPTQIKVIRVDAAKATYRLSRGQNAATTMMAHAQAAGAKNIDPAFWHHRQVVMAWAMRVWEGAPDLDTLQVALGSALARLNHLKRPWWGATDAAATFVLTLLRWVGTRSLRGISPPTTARRSTSLLWRRRRWVSGWIRLLSGFSDVVRQLCTLWHNRPPDGILEGHIFTDGSSAGSGALRRSGWAVVAVDDLGNLNAAVYGAVPIDVLPGQTSRDGEDYAAAMAGIITMDLLTLHIDCEGTIATVNGPKCKALVEQEAPEQKSGAGFWTTRSGQSSSRATPHNATWELGALPTCSKGETTLQTPLQRKGQTHNLAFRVAKTVAACASLAKQAARWAAEAHVLLRFRGWDDTRAAAPRPRGHRVRESSAGGRRSLRRLQVRFPTGFPPSFSHASRKTVISTHGLSEGTARSWDEFRFWESSFGPSHHLLRQMRGSVLGTPCAGIPRGRTSQLCKLRSGLFPNRRYPGWTVEHVRRHFPGRGNHTGGAVGIVRGGFWVGL